MNEIKIFENAQFGQIRTAGTSNDPLFCAIDIARALNYSNPAKAVIDHCKGVTILETPSNGGVQNTKFIDEGNMYRLILKSKAPQAEAFQDWVCEEVLPSIRKTGSYSVTNQQTTTLQDKLQAAAWAAEFLKMNNVSKLMMAKAIMEPLGLPTPDYVESKGVHLSAHELLKKHNAGISPKKFNEILIRLGYLTEMERDASNGKRKKFKLITNKGEEYGENMVSPYNANETQPHCYVDKFPELLAIVKDRINE